MGYRAAVVGCGRIAGRLDDDPRRSEIWTHAGAYTAVSKVALVAAADIDLERLEAFGKRWQVPMLYQDYRQMLAKERLDILSICTHSPLHLPITKAAVEAGVQAIFCEKPLAECLDSADQIVALCQERGVTLAVNHTRRWDCSYRKVNTCLATGQIGKIQAMTAYYTGGVANIGSHLFDVLRLLGGEVHWVQAATTNGASPEDPDLSGSVYFTDGFLCHIHGCNQQNYLLIEIDILGTNGRLKISQNGACVEHWTAQQSERYSGYHELVPETPVMTLAENRRMVHAVEDITACLESGAEPQCSGQDGRGALELVAAFRQSYLSGGEKVYLPMQERRIKLPSK
ncbi:MAG: Gfo/Idh/MocA family oxidoreductase [Candidatus Tectomicrobia bacterium]